MKLRTLVRAPVRLLLRPYRLRRHREAALAFQRQCLPEAYLPGIGIGDFVREGDHLVKMLRSFGGLRRADRVLDLGCGLGRVAMPLQRFLRRGTYDGLDIVADVVHWDTVNITGVSPDFRFKHLDVRNSTYNPAGTLDPTEVVFPYPDGSFTFACATSLFSHLLEAATRRYLTELARVLRPGGRAVLTFFLLDAQARERVERGETDLAFPHPWPRGRLDNLDQPEDAVAFDAAWLLATLAENGFEVRGISPGQWSGNPRGRSYQDVVLVERGITPHPC